MPVGGGFHEDLGAAEKKRGSKGDRNHEDLWQETVAEAGDAKDDGFEVRQILLADEFGPEKFCSEAAPAPVDGRLRENEDGQSDEKTEMDGVVEEERNLHPGAEGHTVGKGQQQQGKPAQQNGANGARDDLMTFIAGLPERAEQTMEGPTADEGEVARCG